MFTAVDYQRLPHSAICELALILTAVERQMTWPVQTMLIIGRLILKRVVTKDKAIGLVSMLRRLWSLLREHHVRDWPKDNAEAWDAAVTGNSCLREAYLRSIGGSGVHHAHELRACEDGRSGILRLNTFASFGQGSNAVVLPASHSISGVDALYYLPNSYPRRGGHGSF